MTFSQQIISSRLLQVIGGQKSSFICKFKLEPITTCSNLILIICCENVMDITFFFAKNVKTF